MPIPGTYREVVAARIAKSLDPERHPLVSGLWKGEPAARVALRVARDVFLGNWPGLQTIRTPVKALRLSRDGPVINPFKDLYDSLTAPPESLEAARTVKTLLAQADTSFYKYPEIIPTDVSFRSYIDLLAAEEKIPEIPLALAWMRELGVKPSKQTLATAMVYFAQVGTDAPLVELVKGGPDSNPYSQLSRWIVDWVGHEKMPGSSDLSYQWQRVDYYWRSDYVKVIEDRNKATWETEVDE